MPTRSQKLRVEPHRGQRYLRLGGLSRHRYVHEQGFCHWRGGIPRERVFVSRTVVNVGGEDGGGDHTRRARRRARRRPGARYSHRGVREHNRSASSGDARVFSKHGNDVGGVRHSERDSDVQHTCARGEASSGGAPFAFGVNLCDESETNSTTCNESFTTFVHRTHASRVSRVIVCSLLRTMVDLASASTNNFAASTRRREKIAWWKTARKSAPSKIARKTFLTHSKGATLRAPPH